MFLHSNQIQFAHMTDIHMLYEDGNNVIKFNVNGRYKVGICGKQTHAKTDFIEAQLLFANAIILVPSLCPRKLFGKHVFCRLSESAAY